MQIVGEGLDEILERLAAGTSSDVVDGWGSWGGADARSASAPQPTPFEQDLEAREHFAKVEFKPDPQAIAAAERDVEIAEAAFEHARLTGDLTQQVVDDMKLAQGRLRAAKDPGAILVDDLLLEPDVLEYEDQGGDGHIVNIPAADEHRKAMRRQLAEGIDLPGFFPAIMRSTEAQRQEIIETYVKGGPIWLSANRDIVKALPTQAKVVMVQDVMLDSNRLANEFGRDFLKEEDIEGAGLAVAQDNIDGVVDRGGAPYEGR